MTTVRGGPHGRRPPNVMSQMLAHEYRRVLGTLSSRDGGEGHSSQQIAHAKILARRNVLDRLEARAGHGRPAT